MSIESDRETASLILDYLAEEVFEIDLPNTPKRSEIVAEIVNIIQREPPDPPGWEGGFAENH